MNNYVIDASALLALINEESGSEKVKVYLANACMSVINVSETAAVLHNLIGFTIEEIESLVHKLIKSVIPFEISDAYQTAFLRKSTKNNGLSFGDRACLALAKQKNLPVITADKMWAQLNIGVEIILVR